jgi:hypothetical protein
MSKLKKFSVIILFVSAFAFAGCGGSSNDNSSNILFEDHFSYTAASPWSPENGWSSTNGNQWNITAGGVSGNALEYPGTGYNPLINSFIGTDYQVSVRFKPVNMHIGGWPIYILARVLDDGNWYGACIVDFGANSYLRIVKLIGGNDTVIKEELFKNGLLDSSEYYTLTIKVQGSTITAMCSGEILPVTISATDVEYSSGKVGIVVWDNTGTYSILFDDFSVSSL